MANSVFVQPGQGGSATFSGPILNGDGSVSAPSYSFSSHTNTGFYQGNANEVDIAANGAQVVYFNATGVFSDRYNLDRVNGDVVLVRDAAGILAQKNAANAQTIRVYGTTTGPKYVSLAHDGTNGVIDTAASSGLLSIAPTNATSVTVGKAVSSFNGVATAGFGLSPIVAAPPTSIGAVAAVTNLINYTPPAVAATYCLFGVVNVTAWTTPASFTVVATYKDGSGNARTDTAAVFRGSTGAAAAAVTAVDRWYFGFDAVDVDNSATAITLSTTGTFTGSPVYNFQGTLQRVR